MQEAVRQASSSSGSSGRKPGQASGGLVEKEGRGDITDQIPHIVRPMGVVEGTSYTVLIIAGLAFAGEPYWPTGLLTTN